MSALASTAENPKRAFGIRKLPMELIPVTALVQEAAVFGLGADYPGKAYGRFNWRDTKIDALTYVGAIGRHMALWGAGEDLDPESGVSHLAHVRACCGMVLDSIEQGTFIDNRKKSEAAIRMLRAYDVLTLPVVKPAKAA